MIPIVLVSNNEFAPYMGVTMLSIMENKCPDTTYEFYLLVSDDFSDNNQRLIKANLNKYTNYSINIVQMGKAFSDAYIRPGTSWSIQMYYKLLIAEVLPTIYDRCIYMDSDLVVNIDLTELFTTSIGNNYIGMVRPTVKNPYNAGVLLVNLTQIRANKLTKLFCDYVTNNNGNRDLHDQRILNEVCAGNIYRLPYKYNVLITRYDANEKDFLAIMSKEEMLEGKANPAIIHYASKAKPWNTPSMLFAEKWYYYARKTIFYEIILNQNMVKNVDGIAQLQNEITQCANKLSLFAHKRAILFSYYRYTVLSMLTFGKKSEHYRKKKTYYHELVRQIRNLLEIGL